MNNYKGDTFWRTYKVRYENAPYTFQVGDIIKAAFILKGTKYIKKEITLDSQADSVTIEWTADEMKKLKGDEIYILEAEITTTDFVKTYQENINIKKDYI